MDMLLIVLASFLVTLTCWTPLALIALTLGHDAYESGGVPGALTAAMFFGVFGGFGLLLLPFAYAWAQFGL